MQNLDETGKKLDKLFDYGFISIEEKKRLLAEYQLKGLTPQFRKDIEEVLKTEIKVIEEEIDELSSEIKDLETKNVSAFKKTLSAIVDANLSESEKIKENLKKKKEDNIIKRRKFHYEMKALDRKMEENDQNIRLKLEEFIASKIRQDLNS